LVAAEADIAQSDPLINRAIEGYEFIRRLGEGTYGVVYLARHPRIERLVAVKYLKLGDPTASAKVQREVDILARLQHPNVIHIYDAYRFDHYQLIVMELVRGGSLAESLQRLNGLLDLQAVIEGIEQLAYALGYVHEQNILHLDLKPANVLLDPIAQGQFARFVLTDFGIAQIVNPGSQLSTNMVGTPMYMSPEHFGFGDNKPDNRSDIYSLGIILYELVVGRVPFQSKQLLDLLNQHAYAPVPLPSASIPNLPMALDNIILKALAKAPADRFQSATEMGNALRELRLGPLMGIQDKSGRLSGQALGAIAQQGAQAMEAMEEENPAKAATLFNLVVIKPDGTRESIGFQSSPIIMGREKGVDLQLAQTSVSRRHAQIDCDHKGNIYVTDLQSANGTYLDGVRLTPQERVPWKLSQFLQVQGFLLQIDGVPGTQGGSRPLMMTSEQVRDLLDKLHDQRKKPVLHVSIAPAIVYVEVGKPQYIQVRTKAENTPLARYELRAKPGPGIDERWYTLPAGQVIPQDGEHTFDFIVSTPSVGTIGGKTHEIALEVVADNPDIPSAYQILKVRVVPFTRFLVALRPSEVSHNRRRRAELTITNSGNQPETFAIEVEAPDSLQVVPKVTQLTVDPAQEHHIPVTFKPGRDASRLRTRLMYAITVHSASGKTERTNGSYIFRRQGRAPLLLFVLLALAIFVAGRHFLFGVSVGDQFNELRAAVEYLIRLITNRGAA
jgi:serine/threonine protein kinase